MLNNVIQFLFILLLVFTNSAQADYSKVGDFANETSKYKALVFLSESCPCSKSHIEHVQNLIKQYPNLKVFGVVSEPPRNAKQKLAKDRYFLKTKFGFSIIQDPDQSLVKRYKALKTPHVVLIRQNHLLKEEILYEGGLTDSKSFDANSKKYLEQAMADLSSGQQIKIKKGFCLGCYIRRF